MIVRLHPISEDCSVWQVSVDRAAGPVAVDYTELRAEQRSFVGAGEGYFEAEPTGDGWDLRRRVSLAGWGYRT